MAFKFRFINGIGLWAMSIATAVIASMTPPSMLNEPSLDLLDLTVPGALRTREQRSSPHRSMGSRHHRHFAKARASGRHDFRATL